MLYFLHYKKDIASSSQRHTKCVGERSFGELAEQFEMSRPAVSQHLKVLKDNGFVLVRAEAQRRIYRLNGEGLASVGDWLTKVRTFWADRLDQLDEALAQASAEREPNNE